MLTAGLRPLITIAVAATMVLFAFAAAAQQVGTGRTGYAIVDEQRTVIEGVTARTDALEKQITLHAEDDAKLVEIRLQLEELAGELLTSALAFRPRLTEISNRIEQLGPPPAEGQPPEPDIVDDERQSLIAEKAEINAVLGLAESQTIRINGLVEKIGAIRRDLFTNLLTKRYQITDAFSDTVGTEVQRELSKFFKSVWSWVRFAFQFKLNAVLAATFFALLAAAVLQFGGRRVFGQLLDRDPTAKDPSYLKRLSTAFWSTLLPTAAIIVFFVVAMGLYQSYNILRGDIGDYIDALLTTVLLGFFVYRLSTAVLAPKSPGWRLIPIESRPARTLVWLMTAIALVVGIDNFFDVVSATLSSPLSVTILKSLVAAIVVGVLMMMIGRVRPFVDKDGQPKPWPASIRFLLYALGAATIIAALLGYISLAQFVSQQIVSTGGLLATAYIGFLASRTIAEEGGFAATAGGRWVKRRYEIEETSLDQIGLAVSMLINVLIVVVFLPLLLFQWGFQPGDIATWIGKLSKGFQVGGFSFAPFAILTGLVVLVAGWVVTRWFQRWLDGTVMARGRVDAGVRNSIRTVVGYAGLAVSGLIAVSAAGFDLSNLALIAGGLSLGIGFGLQNIVQNFVSGLILLAERPFKAGDWIVAGAVSGTVKKISVRATEIETFQRQTVILPNSELINAAVGNWTHRNRLGRVDIKVNVAYGADIHRAHAVMTEIARSHPLVLRNPEPFVLFQNFGTAALEFEIRVFVADILSQNAVQNDIRFGVFDAFAREHIEIPSTPRAPSEAAKAEEAAAAAALAASKAAVPAPKPGQRRRKPDPDLD